MSGIEAHLLHEIRPVLGFEAGLRIVCRLARAGETNANGENPPATAVFLDKHPKQLYMAEPSIGAQDLLIGPLAPIGRVLGYESDYPPVRQVPSAVTDGRSSTTDLGEYRISTLRAAGELCR